MTCREFNEFLIDYRSGGLTPEDCAHFEAHLAECSHCVMFLKSYEETIRLAKGTVQCPDEILPMDVPEELVQAILAVRLRVRH